MGLVWFGTTGTGVELRLSSAQLFECKVVLEGLGGGMSTRLYQEYFMPCSIIPSLQRESALFNATERRLYWHVKCAATESRFSDT